VPHLRTLVEVGRVVLVGLDDEEVGTGEPKRRAEVLGDPADQERRLEPRALEKPREDRRRRGLAVCAGKLEPGERPLRAAKRELAEETGCRARSWRKLLELYPSPGFCDERLVAYFAESIIEGEPAPEPYELIEKKWFSWEETMAMVDRHVIRDGKTLAALLYFDRSSSKQAGNTTARKPRGTASRR
jgi:8-oxo-dGTP pyrophosphatase MutT (NUDIX family)